MADTMTGTTDNGAELDDFLGVQPPSRRGRILKWGAIGVGVLLLLLLLSRCVFGSSTAVSYATRPVERGDLTVTVSATGNLAPTNQVEVGSEISGLVTDVLVDDNARVSKGQLLARIDTSRLQDAINQSRAQLQAAQATVAEQQAGVKLAQASLARQLQVYKLSGGKVPSATELDSARAAAAQAVASLQAAEATVALQRATLSSNQTQFDKASIRSPVNGVILLRSIEPGQTVAASLNAPTLFVIAEDLSQMKLEAKVDEADVGQVVEGQDASFTVDAFPGRTFPAKIIRVNVGSTATGTTTTSTSNTVVAYTAVLSVSNADLTLRPGMTATADIVTTEKRNVLLVPNAALRFSPERAARAAKNGASKGITSTLIPARPGRAGASGGGGRDVAFGRGSRQTVYVIGADGTPQPIDVLVGDTDGSSTEVSGRNLKQGTRVITGQLAAGQSADAGDRAVGTRRRRAAGSGNGG